MATTAPARRTTPYTNQYGRPVAAKPTSYSTTDFANRISANNAKTGYTPKHSKPKDKSPQTYAQAIAAKQAKGKKITPYWEKKNFKQRASREADRAARPAFNEKTSTIDPAHLTNEQATLRSNEARYVKSSGHSGWKTPTSKANLKAKNYTKSHWRELNYATKNHKNGSKIINFDSGAVGDRGGGHYDPGTAPQGNWPGAVSRAGDAIKRSRPGSIFRDTVRKGTSQTHIPSRPRR